MLNFLLKFLKENRYSITNPDDFSVQYNYNKKGLIRMLWETIGRIKNV